LPDQREQLWTGRREGEERIGKGRSIETESGSTKSINGEVRKKKATVEKKEEGDQKEIDDGV